MDPIKFTTKLTLEEYRSFKFYSFYGRTIGKMMLGLAILLALISIANINAILTSEDALSPALPLFISIMILVVIPGMIYFQAKAEFQPKNQITEQISYTLDQEWIDIQGESFNSRLSWEKIHKVEETKTFFLVFVTKMTSNIIPKTNMTKEEILRFRKLVRSIPDLKSKLKAA